MPIGSWRNWAGNQSCAPEASVAPASVAELRDVVRRAGERGGGLRVAGSGHSFTPLVGTSGTLVDLSRLGGEVQVDTAAGRARVPAGVRLHDLGPALWRHGFSIANQGDVDVQTVAGAVATGTKGSGVAHGTMSSRVTGMRLVDGRGELVEIDGSSPERLHAAQVSLGLLGVMTEIDLAVVPAYFLAEHNAVMSVPELMASWDDLKAGYHHFSFWWMPTAGSSAIYGLPEVPADHAYVKMLSVEPVDAGMELEGEVGSRIGRAYRVYPDTELGDPFFELEYVLEASDDRDGFLAVRDLMRSGFPAETSPVQVRWQAADEALLSPQYRRDAVSVSVSGMAGTDYEPFLRGVDALLAQRAARPHWGKIHFLDRARVESLYPALDRFRAVREELDPRGLFLNDHLRELIG